MALNPPLDISNVLKGWYLAKETQRDATGVPVGLSPLVEYDELSIASARERVLKGEKEVYFSTRAMIEYINSKKICYVSCGKCLRALDGSTCPDEKHGSDIGSPTERYILEMHLNLEGDGIVAMVFDEIATAFLGKPSSDMMRLKYDDPVEYNAVFSGKVGKMYNVCLSCKLDDRAVVDRNGWTRTVSESEETQVEFVFTIVSVSPVA